MKTTRGQAMEIPQLYRFVTKLRLENQAQYRLMQVEQVYSNYIENDLLHQFEAIVAELYLVKTSKKQIN